MAETEFSKWLTVRFLEYQAAQKRRVTVEEFAQYLGGVHQVTVSRWMNGTRTPDQGYVSMLADRFGDEVYDMLDLPRPDPRLQAIIANWKCLTDEQRNQLANLGKPLKDKKR